MIRRLVLGLALLALPGLAHAGNVSCAVQRKFSLTSGNLVVVNVTMSTSYATGGDSFSTANVLADVSNCLCGDTHYKPIGVDITNVQSGASPGTTVDFFRYDQTAFKIQAFTATSTEVSSTTNLSAFVLTAQSICI